MQTFLPYADFKASAQVLDNKRLRKQALECVQILNCLLGNKEGYKNHPAVLMWRFNPGALCLYGLRICDELQARGFKYDLHQERLFKFVSECDHFDAPVWLGDNAIHFGHRCRLLQKGIEELYKYCSVDKTTIDWYFQFKWPEAHMPSLMEMDVAWPIMQSECDYSLESRTTKPTLLYRLQAHKYVFETYGEDWQSQLLYNNAV